MVVACEHSRLSYHSLPLLRAKREDRRLRFTAINSILMTQICRRENGIVKIARVTKNTRKGQTWTSPFALEFLAVNRSRLASRFARSNGSEWEAAVFAD